MQVMRDADIVSELFRQPARWTSLTFGTDCRDIKAAFSRLALFTGCYVQVDMFVYAVPSSVVFIMA